jgi:2-keto-3-deoxy-L-rhamnonate aldolase RhmA
MGSTAKVKQKLRAGEIVVGSWLTLGSPAAAEVMAEVGFDFLIIEGEHAGADMSTVLSILQAMRGSETVPVLRVPSNDRAAIKVALDVGVKGIMVPLVNSRVEAEDMVRSCKYPPAGVRGIGTGRASFYGARMADYLREANDDVLIFPIVEHDLAVKNVDEILNVPGIDAFFFGYADYGASLGLTGQFNHPLVLDAREKILASSRRWGIPAAHHAGNPTQARELVNLGFRMITIASDAALMYGAGRESLESLQSLKPGGRR